MVGCIAIDCTIHRRSGTTAVGEDERRRFMAGEPTGRIGGRACRCGFDVADNEIVKRLSAGDLVITSDIPLAAEVVEKGGLALSPRGELHTKENIRARLNMRDFLDTMRATGIDTGGPPALSQSDRKAFAGHLDRLLTKGAGNT